MKKTILSIVMAALCLIFKAHAQSGTTSAIRGKIIDQRGQPLPGATIKIKGSSLAGSSDEQGRFSLSGAQKEGVLLISFLGYLSQELPFGDGNGRDSLRIVMREDENALREVEINAGYYTVKDRERTGSIARVAAGTIARQPVSNVLGALIGRMPGVNIEQQSGINGGGFKVEIRGINSLRPEGRQPLYLVDGVPYPASPMTRSSFNVGGLSAFSSPLNYLGPADIEGIEVLKDADATAIYGSRGANGVVLISTKKAKEGRSGFQLNVSQGLSQASSKLDLLNTAQYMEMRREAFSNDGASPGIADYDLNGTWNPDSYTDWQELLIGGTAQYTNIQGSLSGGNASTQYDFRGNYSRQSTVFPGDFADTKLSGALTTSHTSADKRFKANFSATYASDHNRLPNIDLTQFITLAPNAPAVYDGNGNLNWALNDKGAASWENPLAGNEKPYSGVSGSFISTGLLNYDLLPGLTLRSSMGYSNIRLREGLLSPIRAQAPSSTAKGSNQISFNALETWMLEPQVNYKRASAAGDLEVLVGATFQQDRQQIESITGTGYTSDLLLESISAAPQKSASSTASPYQYNALFGRINYNYRGKYILNLTGRRDGSSRFGPGSQFANFAAAGMAWIFSEEQFMRDLAPGISFGKLRGSYGSTGSDQIANYGYLETYSATSAYLDGSGLFPTRLANPDYSWETNRKLELAMDLGFAADRVRLSSSWYRNRSSSQLVGYALPDLAGFPSVQYNLPATVENRGWEFTLNSTNVSGPAFSWNTEVSLTLPRNTLLDYPNLEGSSYASTYTIGRSLYTPQVYHYLGVDRMTGVYSFEDIDGSGTITLADRRAADKALTSHAYGGLLNSFSFGRFSAELFFQFVSKTVVSPFNSSQFGVPGAIGNQSVEVLARWKNEGEESAFQKFSQSYVTGGAGSSYSNLLRSDMFEDASFIRLKNVSLSWEAPASWLQKLKLRQVTVFVQGQNLLTWSKYIGDPEVANLKTLPSLTTVSAGLQIGL